MGELEEDFFREGRGEVLIFSCVSGSDFFLGEDLVKKPFMDNGGTKWLSGILRTNGVLLDFGLLFRVGGPLRQA